MTVKQKLAKHFGIVEHALRYGHGLDESGRSRRGWFYDGYFIGDSWYEIQHSPNYALKKLPI